jgi:excinuclease UvrABC nuclease subunit
MAKNVKLVLKHIPNVPGAYLFYNQGGELIYVGKATSLKNRVKSYFQGLKNPRPIEFMIGQVVKIRWQKTDSALEAAILESELIKKYRPKYNVHWKDDKSWNYFLLTKDEYPRLITMREHEKKQLSAEEQKKFRKIFGPYPGLNTKAAIKILRRLFTLSFCQPRAKRPCLYREMGECLGVCTGEISPKEYITKVVHPLELFLSGHKKQLISQIEKRMTVESRSENYEEAGRLRDQAKALRRIRDIAMLNDSFTRDSVGAKTPLRIEGYDISNLGPSDAVGSMVVFDESGPVKSAYRKFNIKTVAGQSDVGCLAEVLTRRLRHPEWPMADVWLIDGGKPQVNRAVAVAAGRTPIIVGIAKGPTRKKIEFILEKKTPAVVSWVENNRQLLIKVRDEAHRFAIRFQKTKRKINT